MSDRMSLEQAKTFATGYGTSMVNEVRAARAIIAQAEQIETLSSLLAGAENAAIDRSEQIKRLQAAVKELSREMEGYRPHEVAWVELTHDDILKFEDMEDTDE